MSVIIPILAQPLAPDNIWFAVLLAVILAWMHGLGSLRDRDAFRRHTPHHRQGIGHRLHELITHRHH